MFKPDQFIKCPYSHEQLQITRVVSLEENNSDYKGWFNLYVIDSEGQTDIILHTPKNPVQIIPE